IGNTGGPLKGINKRLNRRFDWGYDRGFFLESRDGNYRVKMNIWGQLQFSITDSDEQDFDFDWKIRRFRIALNGHIIRPWLDYVLQFSADNQFETGPDGREGFEGFKLRDLYLNFAYNTKLVPRIGRYKVPFTRDQLMSGRDLLLVERSIVNTEFTWGRDSGLAMYGQLGNIITYGASVTSGSGLDGINFSELDFKNLLYTGRIQYNPCCGKLSFGGGAFPTGGDYTLDPSFGRRDVPIIEIGAATLAFPNLNIDQKTPDNNVADRFEELGITQGDVYSIYHRYCFYIQKIQL
ncbi:MAG: porin, partial [Thermodesulfobacteriota bacterium]